MCSFVEQIVVENGHGGHSFYDRYGTRKDARIMTATSVEYGGIAVLIDGLNLLEQSSYRLEGATEVDWLTVGNSSLNAAAVVALGLQGRGGISCGFICWNERVDHLTATLATIGESEAVLETFASVDAEHGAAKCCIEATEDWFAEANRYVLDDAGDHATDGVSISLDLLDEFFHLSGFLCVRTAYRVGFDLREVVFCPVIVEADIAYLTGVSCNFDAELTKSHLGHSTTYDA